MFVRGTPFETFDGEVLPPDTAVVDTTLTPSDVGPIEFSFEPKVCWTCYFSRILTFSFCFLSSEENTLLHWWLLTWMEELLQQVPNFGFMVLKRQLRGNMKTPKRKVYPY